MKRKNINIIKIDILIQIIEIIIFYGLYEFMNSHNKLIFLLNIIY